MRYNISMENIESLSDQIGSFMVDQFQTLAAKYSKFAAESISDIAAEREKKQAAQLIENADALISDYFNAEKAVVEYVAASFRNASTAIQTADKKIIQSQILSAKGEQLAHLFRSLSSVAMFLLAKAEDTNTILSDDTAQKLHYIANTTPTELVARALLDVLPESVDPFGIPT